MSELQTFRLKPNPAGKDRSPYGAQTAQLAAEWVDIKNVGRFPATLTGLELYHLAYPGSGGQPTWERVTGLQGSLGAGQVLRIHSGRQIPLSMLQAQDIQAADYHAFVGRDLYVWNNAQGDSSGIWNATSKSWVDKASYDPKPPEGAILVRMVEKLVPSGTAASRH